MYSEEFIPKMFKALGHPVRYKIVKFLMEGAKCVCKLNEEVEFSQSNLSQHLKILKDAKILKSEKVGLNIHYSIADDDIKELIRTADQIVSNHIKNIKSGI